MQHKISVFTYMKFEIRHTNCQNVDNFKNGNTNSILVELITSNSTCLSLEDTSTEDKANLKDNIHKVF